MHFSWTFACKFQKQLRTLDPAERIKIVRELDSYVLTTAYSVPYLWTQRIVVMPNARRQAR